MCVAIVENQWFNFDSLIIKAGTSPSCCFQIWCQATSFIWMTFTILQWVWEWTHLLYLLTLTNIYYFNCIYIYIWLPMRFPFPFSIVDNDYRINHSVHEGEFPTWENSEQTMSINIATHNVVLYVDSHGTDYRGWMGPCLTYEWISNICVSVSSKNRKCKYIYFFPRKSAH